MCGEGHKEKDHREAENTRTTAEVMGEDVNEEYREEGGTRCVNCKGNHPATDRNCPKRRRAQMIARERDGTGMEGGIPLCKRKTIRRKTTELNADKEPGKD